MGTILFASDLDNTLLFSHRHRQPEDRCVERLNGAEQGFFTRETPDLLPQVVQRVHLLPITTRSIEQYQRIQWPDGTAPRIALTANGAVLLRDGQVDRAWYMQSPINTGQNPGNKTVPSGRKSRMHRLLYTLLRCPDMENPVRSAPWTGMLF